MSSALRRLASRGPAAPLGARALHATAAPRLPYKDSQDRESLKPRRSEGTVSARDDDLATATPDAAFNPAKTAPETEGAAAQTNGNPLEASGANQELSTPTGNEKTQKKMGAGVETSKGGPSARGSTPKRGGPGRV